MDARERSFVDASAAPPAHPVNVDTYTGGEHSSFREELAAARRNSKGSLETSRARRAGPKFSAPARAVLPLASHADCIVQLTSLSASHASESTVIEHFRGVIRF